MDYEKYWCVARAEIHKHVSKLRLGCLVCLYNILAFSHSIK